MFRHSSVICVPWKNADCCGLQPLPVSARVQFDWYAVLRTKCAVEIRRALQRVTPCWFVQEILGTLLRTREARFLWKLEIMKCVAQNLYFFHFFPFILLEPNVRSSKSEAWVARTCRVCSLADISNQKKPFGSFAFKTLKRCECRSGWWLDTCEPTLGPGRDIWPHRTEICALALVVNVFVPFQSNHPWYSPSKQFGTKVLPLSKGLATFDRGNVRTQVERLQKASSIRLVLGNGPLMDLEQTVTTPGEHVQHLTVHVDCQGTPDSIQANSRNWMVPGLAFKRSADGVWQTHTAKFSMPPAIPASSLGVARGQGEWCE